MLIRWHTEPPPPPQPKEQVHKALSQLIEKSSNQPLYKQLKELGRKEGNEWIKNIVINQFDSHITRLLNCAHTKPWVHQNDLLKEYQEEYGETENLPIRTIMGRLMTYNEITSELGSVLDEMDPQQQQKSKRTTVVLDNWKMFPNGEIYRIQYEKPWKNEVDPMGHWGVYDNGSTYRMCCCAEPVGKTDGCWIQLDPNNKSYQVTPYELLKKTNMWKEPPPTVEEIKNDLVVGTAFQDYVKYTQWSDKIIEEWKTKTAPLIMEKLQAYKDKLQESIDTNNGDQNRPTNPYKEIPLSTHERETLENPFKIMFKFNAIQRIAPPTNWERYINEHVFQVSRALQEYTYEKRGGWIVGGGDRVRALNSNGLETVAKIEERIEEIEAISAKVPDVTTRTTLQTMQTKLKLFQNSLESYEKSISNLEIMERMQNKGSKDYDKILVDKQKWIKDMIAAQQTYNKQLIETKKTNVFVPENVFVPQLDISSYGTKAELNAAEKILDTNRLTQVVKTLSESRTEPVEQIVNILNREYFTNEIGLDNQIQNNLSRMQLNLTIDSNIPKSITQALSKEKSNLDAAWNKQKDDFMIQRNAYAGLIAVVDYLKVLYKTNSGKYVSEAILDVLQNKENELNTDYSKLKIDYDTLKTTTKKNFESEFETKSKNLVTNYNNDQKKIVDSTTEDVKKIATTTPFKSKLISLSDALEKLVGHDKLKDNAQKLVYELKNMIKILGSADERIKSNPNDVKKKQYEEAVTKLNNDDWIKLKQDVTQWLESNSKFNAVSNDIEIMMNNVSKAVSFIESEEQRTKRLKNTSERLQKTIEERLGELKSVLDWTANYHANVGDSGNQIIHLENYWQTHKNWSSSERRPEILLKYADACLVRHNSQREFEMFSGFDTNDTINLTDNYSRLYIGAFDDQTQRDVFKRWHTFVEALVYYDVLNTNDSDLTQTLYDKKTQIVNTMKRYIDTPIVYKHPKKVSQILTTNNISPITWGNPSVKQDSLFFNGNIKWAGNSCWLDSVFASLFTIPKTEFELKLQNTHQINTYGGIELIYEDQSKKTIREKCSNQEAQELYRHIIDDIKTYQNGRGNMLMCREKWTNCLYKNTKSIGEMELASDALQSIFKILPNANVLCEQYNTSLGSHRITKSNQESMIALYSSNSEYTIIEQYAGERKYILSAVVYHQYNHFVTYLYDPVPSKWWYFNFSPSGITESYQLEKGDLIDGIPIKSTRKESESEYPEIWIYRLVSDLERIKESYYPPKGAWSKDTIFEKLRAENDPNLVQAVRRLIDEKSAQFRTEAITIRLGMLPIPDEIMKNEKRRRALGSAYKAFQNLGSESNNEHYKNLIRIGMVGAQWGNVKEDDIVKSWEKEGEPTPPPPPPPPPPLPQDIKEISPDMITNTNIRTLFVKLQSSNNQQELETNLDALVKNIDTIIVDDDDARDVFFGLPWPEQIRNNTKRNSHMMTIYNALLVLPKSNNKEYVKEVIRKHRVQAQWDTDVSNTIKQDWINALQGGENASFIAEKKRIMQIATQVIV